ncbi:MAG: DUF1761 domain-containing protein [Candidatus Methanoperedens sp.]
MDKVAVANMIIGMFWYSPYLFGNIWLKLIGKKPEELREVSRVYSYSYSVITSLIAAAILDFFILLADASTIFDGIKKTLFSVHCAYQLIAFVIMSAILTGWT